LAGQACGLALGWALREQLQGSDGEGMRAPRGENRQRIIEYLKGLDGRGARMTAISKGTGISVASTSYTLQHNKKDFVKDENGFWKLKLKSEPMVTATGSKTGD
jgi:hypothetical protein